MAALKDWYDSTKIRVLLLLLLMFQNQLDQNGFRLNQIHAMMHPLTKDEAN